MSIMSSPFKHPKSGIYYLRKGVPKRLVPIIGKAVFKQSLNTKDLREAKSLIIPLLADVDNQIRLAELQLTDDSSQELSLRDCQIIANRWYVHTRDKIQATDNYEDFLVYHNKGNEHLHWDSNGKTSRDGNIYPHWFGLSDTLSLQGSEIQRATSAELMTFAKELSSHIDSQLKRDGLSVSHTSSSYINLAKAFYSHIIDLEKLCLSRHRDNWTDEPRDMSLAREQLSEVSKKASSSKQTIVTENSISNVYEHWRASDILQNKGNQSRLKTLDETKAKVERFVAILGDMDVTTISKSDIVKFRDILLQLPKNRTQAVKSMTISKQIQFAETSCSKLLSPKTVANAIKQISPVFTYAVEMGLISFNPTFGVSVKNTQKKTEVDIAGRGYTPKDIEKLFADELFTKVSSSLTYGLACYWVPLLCRYTGARLSEIAQLDRSDIGCNEEGIQYLNIRRGEGQSIKTDSSLRHIPVPAHILELGFLDYVDKAKGRLFPDLTIGTYGRASGAFSKWWSARVKSKGISISQPTHAFRHTFKTDMRALGISDSVSDAITGHAAKSEGGRYGSVPLKTKKEAIDRLNRLDVVRIY
ncbi:phage integrase, putative [Paraglaciecola chathamensis S18K6]|uniref:Phage integrase, putative n=2 Tax=Paraglaciecola chathamensis TaxID=368405 RepID=A0AAV3V1Y3_9ALTE|nr:phage integrase, putative [Paraglaciecola chathamensis S18K6]